MTKEQAVKLFESGFWSEMSFVQRAKFQLYEPRLCMPFGVFQEAMEKALERPVFIHEFGMNVNNLKKELLEKAKCSELNQNQDQIH